MTKLILPLHEPPPHEAGGKLIDASCACQFCLAGRALLTLRSTRTGARYTYRVKKVKETDRWFVSLLSGPDNTQDYVYLGMIDSEYVFKLTHKSLMTDDSTPVKAFRFFAQQVINRKLMPAELEVFHEGRCGRCGRVLTVPESIERGIGPECASKVLTTPPTHRSMSYDEQRYHSAPDAHTAAHRDRYTDARPKALEAVRKDNDRRSSPRGDPGVGDRH